MIELRGGDEQRRLAVELLRERGDAVTDVNLAAYDKALGEALLSVGQEYLARVSDEWDVELFFEVYGTPPAEFRGWPEAILGGFDARPDVSIADRSAMWTDARDRALRHLDGGSSS